MRGIGNLSVTSFLAGILIGQLLGAGVPALANDLRSAYAQAQTRDASLQAAAYQRAAAVEVRPQALAAFLPKLDADAGLSAEQISSRGLAAGDPSVADESSAHGRIRNYGLSLSQTVWSTESFQRLKEADLQVAGAEATFRSAQQALILRVAQSYFNILAAADQLATNRRQRDAFAALLHQAQVREQTGVGPHADVAQAQSFYDATEQSVIDADSALDDARRALAEITGTLPASTAPLVDEIPLSTPDPISPDDWVHTASEENFDVRAATLKAEAAQREVAAQRARHLPTLEVNGSSTIQQQSRPLGPDTTDNSIGVILKLPLYQGGTIASLVRQAQAAAMQTLAELEAARRSVERQTRAAFRGITSGIARIAAARRAMTSGAGAVEASRRNIEFGVGSEFDLLNAQNNYYAAVRAYQQSRYDYLTQTLNLKQQAGQLTEQDLAAIDMLLVSGNATPTP